MRVDFCYAFGSCLRTFYGGYGLFLCVTSIELGVGV